MAIVFISPKEKQKMFVWVIAGSTVLIMAIIALVVFLSGPQTVSQSPVALPSLKINFDILNSDQIKNLELFTQVPPQFSYRVSDKDSNIISGIISAPDIDTARQKLKDMGYHFLDEYVQQVQIGRDEPYVKPAPSPSPTPTPQYLKQTNP